MHSLKIGRSSGACAHGSAMNHEDHVKQRPQKSNEHFTNRRQPNCHSNGDCKAFHRKTSIIGLAGQVAASKPSSCKERLVEKRYLDPKRIGQS